jgi:rod shape determining protein RodA
MKIAFILMLAYIITSHNVKRNEERTIHSDLWLILKMILAIIPIGLLLALQKDFGTALVFIAILGGVMILSGITWKILVPIITLVAGLGAFALYMVMSDLGRQVLEKIGFEQYQFNRIDAWLHPFANTSTFAYQPSQGLLAIGSGGLLGKGFNHSQVYVPVRESDMIFTVIGENFGFIGSTFVILLYFILIYRMIRVTFDSNNEFYTYISTGIIMMILFHVFENVGSNIGILPLTGIPLPFISQGGTSLIGNMIGIGLILSMKYHRVEYEELKHFKQSYQPKRIKGKAGRHG